MFVHTLPGAEDHGRLLHAICQSINQTTRLENRRSRSDVKMQVVIPEQEGGTTCYQEVDRRVGGCDNIQHHIL